MLRRKCLLVLQTAMLILCAMSFTAYGHPVPDLTVEGSVKITMRYEEQVVPGGTMTQYRVGDVRENNGDYDFVLAGDFADSGIEITDIQSGALAAELAGYAAKAELAGDTKTIGSDGVVLFENLKAGLYLFVQNDAADGYNKVSPFLVSLPMLEDGKYVYDVEAGPKTALKPAEPEPTEPEPTRPSRPDDGDDDDDDDDEPYRPTRPSSNNNPTDSGMPTDEIHDSESGGADPTEPAPTDASSDEILPQTGQLNWPVPVLAATGLVVFAMGWGMFNRKREGDET